MISPVSGQALASVAEPLFNQPRIGFLGAGRTGCRYLQAIARTDLGEIIAVADSIREMALQSARVAPEAVLVSSLDELLEMSLDGLVIATSATRQAEQAIAALEHGIAVFCQKPLGKNQLEVARVVAAARRSNVLLGVDCPYRFVRAVRKVSDLIHSGELGRIFAVDLVFHDSTASNNGCTKACVMDLGSHLVDLALWMLDYPRVDRVSSRLFVQGKPVHGLTTHVEDYAVARLDLDSGVSAVVSCARKVLPGCDSVISGTFYGAKSGARFQNAGGSLSSFTAERFRGTSRERLACADDNCTGQAVVQWAAQLAAGAQYDPEIERLIDVAGTVDAIYTA